MCTACTAAAYSFSFGPLCWLVTVELFSAGFRGRAIGIATVFNWLFNLVVAGAFEPLRTATSSAFVFGASFCAMVLAMLFFRGFLPETRGIELDDVVTFDVLDVASWPRRCCGAFTYNP